MLDASANCGSGTVGLVWAFTTGAQWPMRSIPAPAVDHFGHLSPLGRRGCEAFRNYWFRVLGELSVA